MQRAFPFLSLRQSVIVLRLSMVLIFLLHAVVRLFNGTIPQFAAFLTAKGIPFGKPCVIAITVFEIVGSILLAMNLFTRCVAAGFVFLLLMGIVLIHFGNGWFVGEHGSGGCEYSFMLIAGFLVIAAGDTGRQKK